MGVGLLQDRAMVSRRLKLLAPAPARTRVPSWAIRLTVTSFAADQHRQHLGQEVLDRRLVLDPEVVEHVIVDRHGAAEPAVGVALAAEACQFATAGDPLSGGIEPERHQQLGVGGRPPRLLAAGPDRRPEPTRSQVWTTVQTSRAS